MLKVLSYTGFTQILWPEDLSVDPIAGVVSRERTKRVSLVLFLHQQDSGVFTLSVDSCWSKFFSDFLFVLFKNSVYSGGGGTCLQSQRSGDRGRWISCV